MTTTQSGPKALPGTWTVQQHSGTVASVSKDSGVATTNVEVEMGDRSQHLGEEVDSGIDGTDGPDVCQLPVIPPPPRLELMNPRCPVRYIPIHVWPEYLKKVQPRTGRRYCPKRSRTLPRRNGPSPLVREYRYTEDDGDVSYEDEKLSDTETTQSSDVESVDGSTVLPMAKRRGWRFSLLGAMQNAVPKRYSEEKRPPPRRPLSLTPLRFGQYPPGLMRRGSQEGTGR